MLRGGYTWKPKGSRPVAPSGMDSAFDICLRSMNDGDFGIGGSATVEYHFHRTSVAVIGTLTWTWNRDRFELAAFSFLNAQVQDCVALVNPNWTYEISRQWTFIPECWGRLWNIDGVNAFQSTSLFGYDAAPALWRRRASSISAEAVH